MERSYQAEQSRWATNFGQDLEETIPAHEKQNATVVITIAPVAFVFPRVIMLVSFMS